MNTVVERRQLERMRPRFVTIKGDGRWKRGGDKERHANVRRVRGARGSLIYTKHALSL